MRSQVQVLVRVLLIFKLKNIGSLVFLIFDIGSKVKINLAREAITSPGILILEENIVDLND